MKALEEKQDLLIDDYITLRKTIKAKSARVEKEQTEMEHLIREFEKKHRAGGRPAFVKRLDFYLDSLNAFEYNKILLALDEEIQALKRETEESIKLQVDMIKKFEEFMGSPEQHFK